MQEKKDIHKIIEELNPQQQEAVVNTIGPELVIAGAGSGKTRVLTTRIALLMEQGIMPERILALTFTKKAAEEMRARITKIYGAEAARLRMGTFHSVFITFLRPYASMLGFPESFTILDEEDSLACMKRCIREVLHSQRPPKERWTKAQEAEFKAEDMQYKPKSVLSRISIFKNELVTADEYAADKEIQLADKLQQRPLIGKMFIEYRNACFRSGVMDFDDILLYTDILLANNPAVCSHISACFDYILVDEYQDTNMAQYSILQRLTQRNKNICVVGDDSQSIYAFRGARIENIFSFEKDYPGCKTVRLEQNYRSTRNIVEAANRLISFNEARIPKTCFTASGEGEPIEFVEAETEKIEADYIAQTIAAEKKARGLSNRDFALLYRTNSQSRALEEALIRMKLPYVIYSGTSFLERMEIKDQMAYFKLAVNPDDDESLRRIINKPVRGLGDTALDKLSVYSRSSNISIWKTIESGMGQFIGLRPGQLKGLEEFHNIIDECRQYASTLPAYEAAKKIVEITGLYDGYVTEENEEAMQRADNIRELTDAVKSYEDELQENNRNLKEEDRQESTLEGFLENIMLLSNADTSDGKDDKVNLMTVHCAKGLEFPYVFVTGMEEKLFPLAIEGTPKEEEEERRLFYVAVTRAQKTLVLTKADKRLRFGKREFTKQSRFVEELMGELETKED